MKIFNRTGIAGRDKLAVRRKGNCLTIHLLSNSRALATVEPVEVYSGMYRVKLPGGSISDMTNLSRAVDAAISLALACLNEPRGQETPLGASLVRQNGPDLAEGGAK